MVILEAVASPIVAWLTGRPVQRFVETAKLGAAIRKRAGWTWFVPVQVDEAAGGRIAYPLELRSGSVSLLARASGFLVLDETVESLPAGEPAAVTRFLVGGR
jgi:molybdopterin biosynthesis enzyme